MQLNDAQQEAVNYLDGPLMVVAGAGTGKTTVLTEKVKHIISSGLAKPSEILALTFTEKAAREMEERIDKALPMGYVQTWISTFHSFGEQILRQEALAVGLDPGFALMTQAESQLFIKKHLNVFDLRYFKPLGNPAKFVGGLSVHFSRLKDEDVSPEKYVAWVEEQSKMSENSKQVADNRDASDEELARYAELAQAYKTYEHLKAHEGKMDFGDLIYNTLQLFRKKPDVLQRYRDQFKYILIDEYQDTNYTQTELSVLLAEGHQHISVFLDDDQSIYRFRGAAVYNAMDFRHHFPGAKIVVLTENYRSTQQILDRSYDAISHNNPDRLEIKEHIDKHLHAVRGEGVDPHIIWEERGEDEAERVVEEIAKLINSKQETDSRQQSDNQQPTTGNQLSYEPRDIAILVRANNHADIFTKALARHGIPFQFLGPGQLYNQDEIKDLQSYFTVLADMTDDLAMYRLLVKPFFGIDRRDIAALVSWANEHNWHLFESLEQLEQEDEPPLHIEQESIRKMLKLQTILTKHLSLVPNHQPGQLLYFFLEDTGMLQLYQSVTSEKQQKEVLNISRYFDEIRSFETRLPDATVADWLEYVAFVWQQGESPLASEIDWNEQNAVTLLTVHSAKGLEFPIVFMGNLVRDRFPTRNRKDQIPIPDVLAKESLPEGDMHEQEERRLFYVGMTRAKDRLYFTGAKFYGENKRPKKLSGFIFEALGDEIDSFILKTKPAQEKLPFEEYGEKKSEEKFSDASPPVGEVDDQISGNRQLTTKSVDYLTYSRINAFEICPVHYYMQYVLNVPMPPNGSLSFGSTMHNTMRAFYQKMALQKQNGEWITENGEQEILDIYTKSWIPAGFESKAQEDEIRKQGEEWLMQYVQHHFDPTMLPIELEMPFTFKINDLKVSGRIDRIDKHDDVLEIIDYKTGSVREEKELQKDLQLAIYALAIAEGSIYKQSIENIKLSYYFFEAGQKTSVAVSRERLEQAKEEIIEIKDAISQSDFTCSNGYLCQNGCEYELFCNR